MAGKSTGYLKVINDDLLHVSGFGLFAVYSIPKFLNKEIQVPNFINSNLKEVINNKYIFDLKNWESVKDVLILDDKIYLSYIEEPKTDCVNVQILVADYNKLFLNFKKFFTYPECVFRNISPYNAHQAGGKLTELDNKYILLTTGDFRKYELPQDLNSYFGKTLKINKENSNDVNIVSYGHRNIQGLTTTKIENIFISTEHGPLGGDEINLINVNLQENFGWPISSYGTHYDGTFKEEAPLYKSHQNFGFKEPIWYFSINQNDVHGISDVILNHFSEEDSFFIGSLKATLLYEINLDLNSNVVTSITSFKIGERIRDIEFYKEQNLYFLLLEESPAIAILKIKDSSLPTLPVDY